MTYSSIASKSSKCSPSSLNLSQAGRQNLSCAGLGKLRLFHRRTCTLLHGRFFLTFFLTNISWFIHTTNYKTDSTTNPSHKCSKGTSSSKKRKQQQPPLCSGVIFARSLPARLPGIFALFMTSVYSAATTFICSIIILGMCVSTCVCLCVREYYAISFLGIFSFN